MVIVIFLRVMNMNEFDIELADNGAIARMEDNKGCQRIEVVEGKLDKVADCIGRLIISQMNYDNERKAKIKIEYE
jgi:hypothetical protein